MLRYIYNWLLIVDLAINVLFGGSPREMASSRLWRHRGERVANICIAIIDWLAWNLFGQSDHCMSSLEEATHYESFEVWK
jgi:hypothetical protein